MTGERQEFGFTPDWRARVPFWLILPKTVLLVGLPLWSLWFLIVRMHFFDLEIAAVLGIIALVGGNHIVVSAERAAAYQRRLRGERIVADASGLRILPPLGEWRTFPWNEVTELRMTTTGGLFSESFTTVDAGGVTCSIPAWVNNRRELLRLIRFRANLTRERRGWWATVCRGA
ncbi:MAG: hypothetical protein ACOX9R_06505 [Armatimonadota bacterium]|jgi:hypothetical protein